MAPVSEVVFVFVVDDDDDDGGNWQFLLPPLVCVWLLPAIAAAAAAAAAAILPLKLTNGCPLGIPGKGPNGPGNGRVDKRSFSISASFNLCSKIE